MDDEPIDVTTFGQGFADELAAMTDEEIKEGFARLESILDDEIFKRLVAAGEEGIDPEQIIASATKVL